MVALRACSSHTPRHGSRWCCASARVPDRGAARWRPHRGVHRPRRAVGARSGWHLVGPAGRRCEGRGRGCLVGIAWYFLQRARRRSDRRIEEISTSSSAHPRPARAAPRAAQHHGRPGERLRAARPPDMPGRRARAPVGLGAPRAGPDEAAARPTRSRAATDIDLDEALDLILDLQRLKGRHVELRGSGDVGARPLRLPGRGRQHPHRQRRHPRRHRQQRRRGGAPRRGHGRHRASPTSAAASPRTSASGSSTGAGAGSESPGEGIGLHVAQRLVTEDGGSLRAARGRPGHRIVVRDLPAGGAAVARERPRRSEVGRAWHRPG